ncbi:MAG: T9SS type A sorting domain-containing protein, partial [Ignavibacteria bacterium]
YVGIDLVCLQNSFTSMDESINSNEFNLLHNYPNPFNPSTKISFTLPSRTFVVLKIYNLQGKEVETIISEEQSEGVHSHQWNAERFSSGVYFCQLQAGKFISIKKLLLLK